MKLRGYQFGLAIGLGVFLVFSSCKQTGTPGGTSALSLKRISVPPRVFTIAGEALAFEALGDARSFGASLCFAQRLQSRFGKFNHGSRFRLCCESTLPCLSYSYTNVRRYLIYPDLGSRYRNTYVVACN